MVSMTEGFKAKCQKRERFTRNEPSTIIRIPLPETAFLKIDGQDFSVNVHKRAPDKWDDLLVPDDVTIAYIKVTGVYAKALSLFEQLENKNHSFEPVNLCWKEKNNSRYIKLAIKRKDVDRVMGAICETCMFTNSTKEKVFAFLAQSHEIRLTAL
jgi:hypothetical protein